jgi:hypothetical protein
MKRLLTFDQLNELSNWNQVKPYLDDMWNEIIKTDNYIEKYLKREIYHNSNYTHFEFKYPTGVEKEINDIIEKYIEKLEKIDIHVVFSFYRSSEMGLKICYIIIKNKYTKEVKTNRYVYHCSPAENRESIFENGLIPKKHSESKKYKNDKSFSYPAAIFATNTGIDNVWRKDTLDVWRIDTKNLPNKWWYDLNLYTDDTTREIMTYDHISPEYLELVKPVSDKPSMSFSEINNL